MALSSSRFLPRGAALVVRLSPRSIVLLGSFPRFVSLKWTTRRTKSCATAWVSDPCQLLYTMTALPGRSTSSAADPCAPELFARRSKMFFAANACTSLPQPRRLQHRKGTTRVLRRPLSQPEPGQKLSARSKLRIPSLDDERLCVERGMRESGQALPSSARKQCRSDFVNVEEHNVTSYSGHRNERIALQETFQFYCLKREHAVRCTDLNEVRSRTLVISLSRRVTKAYT